MNRGGGNQQAKEQRDHVVEDVRSANGERLYGRRCVRCRHQWALVTCHGCKTEQMMEARGAGPYFCRACAAARRS